VHVRVRSIRLSTAEQEESLPLHDLLQLQSTSTAWHDNHNIGGNDNDCNNDYSHGDDSDSNIIGGVSDAMHGGGEKQVLS
jgi:hypothetical protein